MRMQGIAAVGACLFTVLAPAALAAAPAASAHPAAAFGARPSVLGLDLSPDGRQVLYVVPMTGEGSAVFTQELSAGSKPHAALAANGAPDRIGDCRWDSNRRLVCLIYGAVDSGALGLLPFTRLIAVDADGGNPRMLSTSQNEYSRGLQLGGGHVIDWLPDATDEVLMTRVYLPDDHVGTRLGSSKRGLGVDLVDTRTLAAREVEEPRADAVGFVTDGRGTVRLMGVEAHYYEREQSLGVISNFYRMKDSRDWHPLGDYDALNQVGFDPTAVDADRNVAYGFDKQDGRAAFFSVALDGSLRKSLVFARPDVDLSGMITIGRRGRVVGVTYSTDYPHAAYFDPTVAGIVEEIARALPPRTNVAIVGASADESRLLVLASSDHDPGVYYLFDRKTNQLQTFFVVRNQLEGVRLATVTPVRYPAADGTSIPGYLTLPPGAATAKGLPAIVLPHGGPAARDEWGFDWLAQYFAARGYAVLQPNYRGSSGYGEAWFEKNGFRSWRIAIGDVLDAGRWLVAQGIADPKKLAILGWSYGGYAALQAAVVDPSVFKAVVAIAPVTDLEALKEEHRRWSDFELVSRYVGEGPEVRAGSPADHADGIRVPVLLFHGTMDRTVHVEESQRMAERLQEAHVPHDLVIFKGLGHRLDDSAARAQMLRESDAFLRKAMGI